MENANKYLLTILEETNLDVLHYVVQILITLIGLLASVMTIISAFWQNELSIVSVLCGFIALFFIIFLCIKLRTTDNKLCALRVLAHRGKINTIYFMVYLDFLRSKFNSIYNNEPKTSSLIIQECEFNFCYHHSKESDKYDIDYCHRFKIKGHKGKLDMLILHAGGELVRKPLTDGRNDYSGIHVKYQEKDYFIISEPCISNIKNQRNQVLDRIQCPLPKMVQKEEWLELFYQNQGGSNLDEDAVFVIYPQNYGRKFSGRATINIKYEEPYCADIQLMSMRFDSLCESKMKLVAQFERCDDGKSYQCSIGSLNRKSIYFVMIKATSNF